MALSDIYIPPPEPVGHGALWYYHHIVEALQSDAAKVENDYGSQLVLPPEMLASYLAVVLADRERPPLIVHAPPARLHGVVGLATGRCSRADEPGDWWRMMADSQYYRDIAARLRRGRAARQLREGAAVGVTLAMYALDKELRYGETIRIPRKAQEEIRRFLNANAKSYIETDVEIGGRYA